jgi:hypothetical protein
MAILPVGIGSAEEGGYQIERSLRFNSADDAYLTRTPAGAGNRKTWTWSSWIKLGRLANAFENQDTIFNAYTDDNNRASIIFQDNAENKFDFFSMTGGSVNARLTTTQAFRDFSAWYHVIVAVDTTQATNTDRLKMYVNGVQVTAFSTATYPSQNTDLQINTASAHDIGASRFSGSVGPYYYDGLMTEVHFVDGQQLSPTDFGEFNSDTGVWQPIEYTGTYGTNGFYLDFADNSSTTTLGYDAAGSNDWSTSGFSVTAGAGNDSLVDSPTRYGTDTGAGGEVRGNYATWNPLDTRGGAVPIDGNLNPGVDNSKGVRGTVGVTSGKWYWEFTLVTASTDYAIGISNQNPFGTYVGSNTDSVGYVAAGGEVLRNASVIQTYGAWNTSGKVVGFALDQDAATLQLFVDGVSQGAAFSHSLAGTIFPMINFGTGYGTPTGAINFGQRPFAFSAPSGFKALVTTNLP